MPQPWPTTLAQEDCHNPLNSSCSTRAPSLKNVTMAQYRYLKRNPRSLTMKLADVLIELLYCSLLGAILLVARFIFSIWAPAFISLVSM